MGREYVVQGWPRAIELRGAGGQARPDLDAIFGTGSIAYFCTFAAIGALQSEAHGREAPSAATIASEQIARIRATFNLNVKLLAEVIGVERPTVYGWIREERNPQAANMERLGKLHELALAFNEVTAAPLPASAVHVPVNGLTLVDILQDPGATRARIWEHAADMLALGGDARRRTRSVREMAQRRGIQLRDQGNSQRRIDALSGYVDEETAVGD